MVRLTEIISRGVFLVASVSLLLLAFALIGFGMYRVGRGLLTSDAVFEDTLLDAVGYVIIAIAVFDVSKYLLEEEVLRGRQLSSAGEARRSMTKFISTISIAVFLEALVTVFEASKQDAANLLYPSILLMAGVLMVVGLGIFQRLTAQVEKEVGEEPEPLENVAANGT